MNLIQLLSLRGRFLIAPIIGLFLTVVLYLASNQVIEQQSEVFQQLSNSNLPQVSEVSQFSVLLSDNLIELIDLLATPTAELDEEQVYLQGRDILNNIHNLRERFQTRILARGAIRVEGVDLTEIINSNLEAYLESAINAIELTTVDKDRAQIELNIAIERLGEIKQLLIVVSEHYVNNMAQASELIERANRDLLPINIFALVSITMMVGMALFFAADLSRGLDRINGTMIRLAQGETNVEIPESDDQYINSLAEVARRFKQTLENNQQQHDELLESLGKIQFSEKRFSDLLELTATAIIAIDTDQQIVLFNQAAEEMFGYQSEEVIGKPVTVLMPEKFRGAHANHVINFGADTTNIVASMGREPVTGLRKNGEKFSIEASISKLTIDGTTLMTASLLDITERLQAERELRQLRNYLENIINSMPSVLIGVDADGKITQWNHQASKETDIEADHAIGQPLGKVLPRYAHEMDRIRLAIETRKEQAEYGLAHVKDGDTVYEDVSIYPLIANGVQGAVMRIDDVTEQIRIKEMMIQSEKMASVGGLAAGMAHEINNPLGGMIQTAAVLRDRLTGDLKANVRAAEEAGISLEQLAQYNEARGINRMLNTIQDSGQRAAEIVGNMLGFTRKAESATSSCDLSGLVEQSLQLAETDYDMKKSFDFRQINVELDLDDNLPPVPCQSQKMQQVLLNLLKNASQAMFFAGTETPTITIKTGASKGKNQVFISVTDNGPGMDEATRKRVFEPFFTTKPVGVGTGLGLSVSYFIITENHFGELLVDSETGVGTSFTILLPIDRERAAND